MASKLDAEGQAKFEREEESNEELGRDESELETDNKGGIESEEDEPPEVGDENLEVTSGMVKPAAGKKKAAFDVFQQPNAATRDCDKAIKLDPNSAQPYKWKAFNLLGHQQAAEDHALACQLDYDEDTNDILKGVHRRVQKISRHQKTYEEKENTKQSLDTLPKVGKSMAEEERDQLLTSQGKGKVQPQNALQHKQVHLWISEEHDSDCCRESEEQKQYPVEENEFYMEDPCRTEVEGKPRVEPKSEDSELNSANERLAEEAEGLRGMGDDNLKAANKMLKQAIEKEREAFHALRAGELHKTVELFTDAIRFSPQLAVLYVGRASVYLRLLKPIAAIRDCDKAIKIDPDSPQPYHWRGKAFQLLGRWHKAARDLELACQLGYNEDTSFMLTEVQRRAQEQKQREDDVVDVAERMKKEPKEARLRTNKSPKDLERIKKAALEEQDSSREKDKSWGEAMKTERIQVKQKMFAEQQNTPEEVPEQHKAWQKAVRSLELEQRLIALQKGLLEQFKTEQMRLEEEEKTPWKVLEQWENAQNLLEEEERNQLKTLQDLEKAQQQALVGLIRKQKTVKEECERAQKKLLEEKEGFEKAVEELARAQKKALEELEMAQKNALVELKKACRKALQEQEIAQRAALEEQKRAQKALEELQLSQRKAMEEQERAQIRAVREQERVQQILKQLAKAQQQALEEQERVKYEQNKANKMLEELKKEQKKALEDLERAQKELLHEQEKAQKKALKEWERAQKTLERSREEYVEKQGNFKEKVFVQWERAKKKLPEDVQCRKNAEETGSVCRTFSVELKITPRKDLKEQATLSATGERLGERSRRTECGSKSSSGGRAEL
ncbi:LOW QUALITY PROTEIN: uncharacterized protein AAHN32_000658 [Aegotheles albertisi]